MSTDSKIPKLRWSYFPKSSRPTSLVQSVVAAFESKFNDICSPQNKLDSNSVLALVRAGLTGVGFKVETGKKAAEKIPVAVLFGSEGKEAKSFHVDAFHAGEGFVLEVEAGRGVVNNQFLKDLFEACMMQDAHYFGVAVRQRYDKFNDYDSVVTFFDTLYASRRLELPLKGILVIGY